MSALRLFVPFCLISLLLSPAIAQTNSSNGESQKTSPLHQSPLQITGTQEIHGKKVVMFSPSPAAPGDTSHQLTAEPAIRASNGGVAIPTVNLPLVPSHTPPGSSTFTLTVNGSGFTSNAVVNWNGTALPTTFVNQGQLTASIPAANVASDGTALVTVTNPGGGTSNFVPFLVTVPVAGLTFSTSTIPVGLTPGNVVVADFNNDGKPDLAVANEDQQDASCNPESMGTVSILLGNGDGTFATGPILCTDSFRGGLGPAMAVGDFNGDGKLDLIVSPFLASVQYGVEVFFGNGDGTFTDGGDYGFGITAALGPIIVGDFNGDGNLDMAFPRVDDFGSNDIVVLLGNGDGTFKTGNDISFCAEFCGSSDVVAADFNEDGVLDLAVTGTDYNGSTFFNALLILLGNGDGTFTLDSQQPSVSSVPNTITVADFDRDGKLDLAGSNLTVLHGNGDGSFSQMSEPALFGDLANMPAPDLNGNGNLDLLFATSENFTAIYGNGNGTFFAGPTESTGNGLVSLGSGDFNGDGRPDIVAVNSADNTISIFLQAPRVGLSSTAMAFAPQNIGTASARQQLSIVNTGSAPLAISAIKITGANHADFKVMTCHIPGKIEPGASCNLQIAFQPSAVGSRTAWIAVYDNAADSPQIVSLSGTGASTTITGIASSSNPSSFGNPVTFTAVITPYVQGQVTGTVTFKAGATTLGTATVSSNRASLTTSALQKGTDSITAFYGGDSNFSGSASPALQQQVQ